MAKETNQETASASNTKITMSKSSGHKRTLKIDTRVVFQHPACGNKPMLGTITHKTTINDKTSYVVLSDKKSRYYPGVMYKEDKCTGKIIQVVK